MKKILLLGAILLLGMSVDASLINCTVLGGNCTIISSIYNDQSFGGTTYYNVSVNVTIMGDTTSDMGLCNISCITNKTVGNFTNRTGGNVSHRLNRSGVNETFVSWCNLGIRIINGSSKVALPLNVSQFVTSGGYCNGSFAIWLNGTTNITAEIRSRTTTSVGGKPTFPLIQVSAASGTLLIAAILIRRWWKKRRT